MRDEFASKSFLAVYRCRSCPALLGLSRYHIYLICAYGWRGAVLLGTSGIVSKKIGAGAALGLLCGRARAAKPF